MAINLPNSGAWQGQLGDTFVQFRTAYAAIVNANAYIAALGGATALEAAPFNFSAGDAQALIAALGNITNLNGINTAIAGSQPFWGGN